MAIPDDLLIQARHLANLEPRRPQQASLRRAVSTAYYALFQLLAAAGAESMTPSRPAKLIYQVRRAYTHADMKRVCARFLHGNVQNLPDEIKTMMTTPLQPEFGLVADAFVQLQEGRHAADYDFSETLTRAEVLSKIDLVDQAFCAWEKIKKTDNANVFLASLLLHRHWHANP